MENEVVGQDWKVCIWRNLYPGFKSQFQGSKVTVGEAVPIPRTRSPPPLPTPTQTFLPSLDFSIRWGHFRREERKKKK
jgi:hypothetical protein